MSDSQTGSPGFESRSDHYLDLFLGSLEFKSSATLVNSQLVCLRPFGILNDVMFNLKYLFQLIARPHKQKTLPRVNKGYILVHLRTEKQKLELKSFIFRFFKLKSLRFS